MKAIMVMFDSLNRHMLPPYGCTWTHAPNFQRLAAKAVTFDRAYVGSMPCIPARRELHTGRYNFLHRSWGPLEPFDDSMPQILREHGVYTHLATDHYHYFEDGGAGYHERYSTYEFYRGQESDHWIAQVADPQIPPALNGDRDSKPLRQYYLNRQQWPREELQPQAQTFAAGLDFIKRNAGADKWFLQLETFDPHEPFFSQEKYKKLYPHKYDGPRFDWPPYRQVQETPEQVQHVRFEYAALLSMCDAHLGKVLDLMDELDLWKDTMLIVNTDHGFMLGEHGCYAKCWMPFYQEVAHMPLFIWDPRPRSSPGTPTRTSGGAGGERRSSLVQTIDLPATLLEYFCVPLPPDMEGRPLRQTIVDDTPVREAGLFGIHGAHVNCTDGRYVYMHAPAGADNGPLFDYTLMPTHMRQYFHLDDLRRINLAEPFVFSKGCRTLKVPAIWSRRGGPMRTLLFDLKTDPAQEHPIQDPAIEAKMRAQMLALMQRNDAPPEQYQRLGLAAVRVQPPLPAL